MENKMNIKADFLHIGGFINNHMNLIIAFIVLSVVCAIACAIITKLSKGLIEDVIFAAVFGFVFNILALLFVIFRKPVWNNLGWIPVVAAWFFIDGNLTFAIILCIYAIIWAFAQHDLLDRITEPEE